MNSSGTQYPPVHAASAATSPDGTCALGTQWALPSVQQLGSDDGSIGAGGASTQDPPELAPPPLLPTEASSPALAPAVSPLPTSGVPAMSVGAEQPIATRKAASAAKSTAWRALRCMVLRAPLQGADHVSDVGA